MSRYTFTVALDGRQARQEAEKLRKDLTTALGEIVAGGRPGAAQAGPDKALAATAKQMDQISKIDLTKPVDDLRAELAALNKEIAKIDHGLQSSAVIGSGPSRAQSQRLNEYADNLSRFVGEEAAIRARSGLTHGGTLNAQFGAVDDTLDPDSMNTRAWAEVKDRRRMSQEQTREYLDSLAEMYDQQIQATKIEKELARRGIQEIEEGLQEMKAAGVAGDDPAITFLADEYKKAEEQIGELSRREAELLADLEQARSGQLSAIQKAGKNAAEIATGQPGTTRQTFTVTKATADNSARMAENAERAAKAAKEHAQWTIQGAEATKAASTQAAENAKAQEGARKAAEVAIQEHRRQTADAEAGSRERIALAEKESKVKIEEARQVTAETKAEEAERRALAQQSTAITKAEAAERTEAARRETLETRRLLAAETEQYKANMAERRKALASETKKFQTMNLGTLGRSVAFGLMGAVGVYSADQAARQLYTAGKTGAQQLRQRDTFENLAAGADQSAERLISAIREASKETINETQAMGLAAQVLAQKFAGSVGDMEGSMGTLTAAARRYSQIFTDEQGAFLTTEEIFARLIKFVREGNKELVDQFGISNARIADVLGIDKNGLASATGAADRFRGLIAILEEDLGRFGEAQISLADEIEASESRITESMNRIRRALAPTTAALAEWAANAVDAPWMNSGQAGRATTAELTASLTRSAAVQRSGNDAGYLGLSDEFMNTRASRLEELARLITASARAAELGVPGAQEYADQLRAIGEEAATTGQVLQKYDETLAGAAFFLDYQTAQIRANRERQAAQVPDPMFADAGTGRSVEAASAQAEEAKRRVDILAEAIQRADQAVEAGVPGAQEYADRLRDIAREAQATGEISSTHMQLIGEVGRWYLSTAEDAIILAQAIGEIQGAMAGLGPAMSSLFSSAGIIPSVFATQQEQIKASMDSEQARFDARLQIVQNDRIAAQQRQIYEAQIAAQAQKEWESAAKSAADAWASELRSALQSVPGLFGTSDVTAEDMKNAELGIYEEKADEYLRQLRDEVRNGKDYPNVSIQDAAARLGMDPNADPEVILRKFEQAWADSSLFAGGQNLDLINEEAVQRELERRKKSQEGRQAIESYFGLPPEDTGGPVGGAAGAAFVETAAAEAPAIGQEIANGMAQADTIQARQLIPAEGGTIRAGTIQVDNLIFPSSVIPTVPRIVAKELVLPPEGADLTGRVYLDRVAIGEQAMADLQSQLAGLTVGPTTTAPENPGAFDWSQYGLDNGGDRGAQIGAEIAGQALAGFSDYDFDGMARAMVTAFSTQIGSDTYKEAFLEIGKSVSRYVGQGTRDQDLMADLGERYAEALLAAIEAAIAAAAEE